MQLRHLKEACYSVNYVCDVLEWVFKDWDRFKCVGYPQCEYMEAALTMLQDMQDYWIEYITYISLSNHLVSS